MPLTSRYRPPVRYPTGWQTTPPGYLAANLSRFGSGGRSGYAATSFPIPGASGRGIVTLNPVRPNTGAPNIAAMGAQGDAGEIMPPVLNEQAPGGEEIMPPALGSTEANDEMQKRFSGEWKDGAYEVPQPFSTDISYGQIPLGGISEGGKASGDNNPLNSAGLSQPAGAPARDTSTKAQSERYYDRKFSKMSRDPVERTFARRIDASAPNVSRPLNPVRFNNTTAGHSDWSPY